MSEKFYLADLKPGRYYTFVADQHGLTAFLYNNEFARVGPAKANELFLYLGIDEKNEHGAFHKILYKEKYFRIYTNFKQLTTSVIKEYKMEVD